MNASSKKEAAAEDRASRSAAPFVSGLSGEAGGSAASGDRGVWDDAGARLVMTRRTSPSDEPSQVPAGHPGYRFITAVMPSVTHSSTASVSAGRSSRTGA